MAVYDLHFNKDDVAIRNILIGLLATLSDSIYWYNQIGTKKEDIRKIDVPFYFSTTGTERYLQDNFLNNIDFDPDILKAETFYNKIPRGIVNFAAFSIETQAIVNKYVRMNHLKQELDGTLNTYSTEAFMVPIIMDINTEIYVDSILDQMKCSEAIIRTFYKAKAYQVDIAYTRIPCLITFPDDYTNERTVEFSFTDKKEFKVNFSLQVKSHIPVFKEGTEIFAGTNMGSFQSNTFIPPFISKGFTSNNGGNSMYSNPNLNSSSNSSSNIPKGETGSSNIVGYNPGKTGSSYDAGFGNDPSWPINPSTDFPPK